MLNVGLLPRMEFLCFCNKTLVVPYGGASFYGPLSISLAPSDRLAPSAQISGRAYNFGVYACVVTIRPAVPAAGDKGCRRLSFLRSDLVLPELAIVGV